MAGVVAFIYILSTIAYLGLGDSSIHWGGFNHITLLLTLAAFMYLPKPARPIEKDLVNYAVGLTIARTLYTMLCIYADISWVYEKTDYFTIAVIVTFIALLVYTACSHKNF